VFKIDEKRSATLSAAQQLIETAASQNTTNHLSKAHSEEERRIPISHRARNPSERLISRTSVIHRRQKIHASSFGVYIDALTTKSENWILCLEIGHSDCNFVFEKAP
jgi:hypothetical protein